MSKELVYEEIRIIVLNEGWREITRGFPEGSVLGLILKSVAQKVGKS